MPLEDNLPIAEIINGLARGVNQGLAERRDQLNKDREYELKKQGLDIKKAYYEKKGTDALTQEKIASLQSQVELRGAQAEFYKNKEDYMKGDLGVKRQKLTQADEALVSRNLKDMEKSGSPLYITELGVMKAKRDLTTGTVNDKKVDASYAALAAYLPHVEAYNAVASQSSKAKPKADPVETTLSGDELKAYKQIKYGSPADIEKAKDLIKGGINTKAKQDFWQTVLKLRADQLAKKSASIKTTTSSYSPQEEEDIQSIESE